MYYGGLVGGQVFFTQAAPFGPVTPSQQNAAVWEDWPAAGVMVINEFSPWWSPGCGHSIRMWSIIREFDYTTDKSVALITCRICNYIQSTMEPFDSWYLPNPANSNQIIIA
jgi:hypothetical protein